MNTVKKTKHVFAKFITMLVALVLLFVPMFAGCDLVTRNEAKYLSQPVASWGDINITKEDLIRTYNNYGYSNFDSSGEVTREGVEKTIDLLIKREVLVKYLTDPKNGDGTNPIVNLTMAQQNEVWQNVYDSINSSVRSIEDSIRADEGATLGDGADEDDSDSENKVQEYSPYEHTYTLQYDETNKTYYLDKVKQDAEVQNKSIALYDMNDKTLTTAQKAKIAYDEFTKNWLIHTDKTDYTDRAFAKYQNNLLTAEDGKELSKDKNEVFLREIERIYKVYYQNQILTVHQENYEDGISIDTDMVQQKFYELYLGQQESYQLNKDNYKTVMQSTSTTAYYNPTVASQQWFGVYHLLVGYSDEQNTQMTELKTMLSNEEISLDVYNKELQAIKNSTIATNRFTGESINYNALLQQIQNAVNSQSTFAAKMAKFREYVYAYSTDTASITAENEMYIPLDKSQDNMVENFANASRELYNGGNGNAGDISGYVETTYGFHIIMYTGPVANVAYTPNKNTLLVNLNKTLLTQANNKTMLDKVLEQITLDTYYSHEQSLVDEIMAGVETKYYLNAYKDMFE